MNTMRQTIRVERTFRRRAGTLALLAGLRVLGFEAVRGAVLASLQQQTYITAVRQYLQLLAGQAGVIGVDIETADTPLVQ